MSPTDLMPLRSHRILVVTDHADATPALVEAMRARAAQGEVQFRLVVVNPARAEVHLLHPERHDKAAEAERLLHATHDALEAAVGSRVIGSVSVRHDPMDAVEETVFSEPVDEIVLAVPGHHLAGRLHQDLAHRLEHLGIPVSVVAGTPATR